MGNLIFSINEFTGYSVVDCNVCGKNIGNLERDILNGKLPKIPKKIKFGGYEVDSYQRPSMKKYNFWHIGTMAVCSICQKNGGLEKLKEMNRKNCDSDCEFRKSCQSKRGTPTTQERKGFWKAENMK